MAKNIYTCPCFSGEFYTECCEPIHKGKVEPETAEQLMRARYTAFCYGNVPFLVDTIHPKKRRLGDAMKLNKMVKKTRWVGLRILDHQQHADKETVDFIAYYIDIDIRQQHELATFMKDKGKWF